MKIDVTIVVSALKSHMTLENPNTNENIFSNPDVIKMQERLHKVLREGWVIRGVKDPETVGEHTNSLVRLVGMWALELGIENPENLKDMLRVHDWPEILDGDELTHQYEGEEYKTKKEEKHARELATMNRLCETLGNNSKKLYKLYEEYDRNETHDTKIGHQLDKVQAILRAYQYEREGQPVSTMEFIDEVRKRGSVYHPFLLHVIEKIEEGLK